MSRQVIVTSQGDLQVEQALGTWRSGRIPRAAMAQLLKALGRCEDVTLDGAPAKISGEPVVPHGVLEDWDEGFRLKLVAADGIEMMYDNGAVKLGGALHAVGDGGLTERELHELPRGRYFAPTDATRLVTEILPELQRRIPFRVLTKRLPSGTGEPPRLLIDVSDDDEAADRVPNTCLWRPANRSNRSRAPCFAGGYAAAARRKEGTPLGRSATAPWARARTTRALQR